MFAIFLNIYEIFETEIYMTDNINMQIERTYSTSYLMVIVKFVTSVNLLPFSQNTQILFQKLSIEMKIILNIKITELAYAIRLLFVI